MFVDDFSVGKLLDMESLWHLWPYQGPMAMAQTSKISRQLLGNCIFFLLLSAKNFESLSFTRPPLLNLFNATETPDRGHNRPQICILSKETIRWGESNFGIKYSSLLALMTGHKTYAIVGGTQTSERFTK